MYHFNLSVYHRHINVEQLVFVSQSLFQETLNLPSGLQVNAVPVLANSCRGDREHEPEQRRYIQQQRMSVTTNAHMLLQCFVTL